MRDPLPDSIDPWALAEQAIRLRGSLPRASLQRLPAVVLDIDCEPSVDLRFGIDTDQQAYVSGRVETAVSVICQRCLAPCELALEADFELGIVATEQQAESLAERYEPLLADSALLLADLVEDELLLVLPAFPRHPEGACRAALDGRSSEVVELDTHRPLAGLGALWQRNESDSS